MDPFVLRQGDVLAAEADGIVIPIDGTVVPRDGQFERVLGNVGRQLTRRFPDAELLEGLEAQVDLPLSLGCATAVELAASPFKYAIVVSTLHHVDHLDLSAKRALVRTSLIAALEAARRMHVSVVASPILQGGWRLRPEDAFAAMLVALDNVADVPLAVYCLDPELHDRLRVLARSMGRCE